MDNAIIQYLVRLQRLAQTASNQVTVELTKLIQEALDSLKTEGTLTYQQVQAIRTLLSRQVDGITIEITSQLREHIDAATDLTPFIVEREFNLLKLGFVKPPEGTITNIKAADFAGKRWSQHGAAITTRIAKRIEAELRQSLNFGEGIPQARNRVLRVTSLARADATKLVRTAINHAANRSLLETYKNNSSVIKGWRFLCTLDNRTSQVCMGLSGQEFKIGQGPLPPRHPNCRSVALPLVKTFEELGIDRPELDQGTQASQFGPVSADLTYEQWLAKQSTAFQRETLGPTKYRLWKDGLSLQAFATDNRPLTINEIKASYAL